MLDLLDSIHRCSMAKALVRHRDDRMIWQKQLEQVQENDRLRTDALDRRSRALGIRELAKPHSEQTDRAQIEEGAGK